MAKLELPSDNEIDSQLLIQRERQERLLQIGWIGRIVGTKEQAPSNIAGATALIAVLALVGLLLTPNSPNSDIAQRTLLPIILAVLGYLFGKSTR